MSLINTGSVSTRNVNLRLRVNDRTTLPSSLGSRMKASINQRFRVYIPSTFPGIVVLISVGSQSKAKVGN